MNRPEPKAASPIVAAILSDLHFWAPLLILVAGVALMAYLH